MTNNEKEEWSIMKQGWSHISKSHRLKLRGTRGIEYGITTNESHFRNVNKELEEKMDKKIIPYINFGDADYLHGGSHPLEK